MAQEVKDPKVVVWGSDEAVANREEFLRDLYEIYDEAQRLIAPYALKFERSLIVDLMNLNMSAMKRIIQDWSSIFNLQKNGTEQ
jgi:hypothetical protein